jgi:Outer membrane protein beta-barrel domain
MKLPLAIVALAFSGLSFAQSAEFWISGGYSILTNKGIGSPDPVIGTPSDYTLGNGFRFPQIAFDLDTRDHLGYEISYAYSRTSLNDNIAGQQSSTGMGMHTVSGDALWHFIKRDSRVRPYVIGGLGFTNFVPPGSSAASGGGSNEFQLNYGVGVKVKAFSKWGKDWGFRADLREYQYFSKPFGLYMANGSLQQTAATVGFGLLF